MTGEGSTDTDRAALAAAVGQARADALAAELEAAGFAVVAKDRLAELERHAGGYRRLRALVDE